MKKHPSGRPIRTERKPKRSEPVWNCPLTEPAVPRLRKSEIRQLPSAVGFYHSDDPAWASELPSTGE